VMEEFNKTSAQNGVKSVQISSDSDMPLITHNQSEKKTLLN